MKEQLISFETAKLAKEKGLIGFHTKGYYNNSGEFIENDCCDHNSYPVEYSNTAITQSLLQKWLREKHKILIIALFYSNALDSSWEYIWMIHKKESSTKYKLFYKTYEDALEKGLQKALKLIK